MSETAIMNVATEIRKLRDELQFQLSEIRKELIIMRTNKE